MTLAAMTARRSVVVSTLGITQTLAWGSTYYLTAVFADPVTAALHLPRAWFFGVFSAALLLSGLLGTARGPDDRSLRWPRRAGGDQSGVRRRVAASGAGD